jgi:hypothetical protein
MRVELRWDECELATWVGTKRQQGATNRPHTRGRPQKSEEEYTETHIQAAGSELAAAKVYNAYWPPSLEPQKGGQPDIGRNIQVRHTPKHNHRLLVTPDALDEQFYVLVTGHLPVFEVVGHIKAGDAKQRQWLTDLGNGRPEAYFVPQGALTPPDLRRRAYGCD